MDALNSMQQGHNIAMINDAKALSELAGGGFWSKFKAHAAKTMSRPGATRQAMGASAVLIGGLAKAGVLASVAGLLGVSGIACPAAAAGTLLVGGAALLAYGSYKVFKHAKAVANQKAQENAKNTGISNPENVKAQTKDIALEFVKQTAENVIFGVPTILIKHIPGVQKKLETYAEKYEAKQSIGKQAKNVINTIKDFEQIPTTINNLITSEDFKANINTKLTRAQNEITTAVKNEAINILETQLKEIKKDQIETIRNNAEKQLNRLLENSNKSLKNYGIDKDKLEKTLDDINKLNLQDLKSIEKGINEKIKNSGKALDFGFKALETLDKEAQNIETAINALKNGSVENLKGEAKNILESAQSEAKDKCKEQINTIKKQVKKEVTKIINTQTEKIQKEIEKPLKEIEQKATAAFSILNDKVKTVESVKEQVSNLQSHTQKKLEEFRNYTIDDSIAECIANLDGDIKDLNNILNKVAEGTVNMTTSLIKDGAKFAKDNAKEFINNGMTAAKENSEQTIEGKVTKTENTMSKLFDNVLGQKQS